MWTRTTILGLALLLGATGFLSVAAATFWDIDDDNDAIDLLSDTFCDVGTNTALASVVSVDTQTRAERIVDRSNDFDEDDVLFAIALNRNGFSVDFDDIVSGSLVTTDSARVAQTTDVDDDGVLAALALGAPSISSSRALACATDMTEDATVTTSVQRSVDLDEADVLLGIALSRNLGGSIDFDDIATISEDIFTEVDFERTVDVDRRDALFLLAFG